MQSKRIARNVRERGRTSRQAFRAIHFERFTFSAVSTPSSHDPKERSGHGGLGAPRFNRL